MFKSLQACLIAGRQLCMQTLSQLCGLMNPPASLKTHINLNFFVGWASQHGKLCKHDGDDDDLGYIICYLWKDVTDV